MSVSLLEVIEHGGYNPTEDVADAQWLLAKKGEFDELVDRAEDFLEEIDDQRLRAEEAQERADELRQSKREDGEAV